MKPYSSYKDSGVEWIGDIPSHWDKPKLKQNIIPEISIDEPILITLTPDALIAVISLFFWRLPSVKTVEIKRKQVIKIFRIIFNPKA